MGFVTKTARVGRMEQEKIDEMKAGKEAMAKVWDARFAALLSENYSVEQSIFKTLPKVYKKLFWLCVRSKPRNSDAIKAKCLDCTGYQKEEVRHCKATACPLFKVRPYQN